MCDLLSVVIEENKLSNRTGKSVRPEKYKFGFYVGVNFVYMLFDDSQKISAYYDWFTPFPEDTFLTCSIGDIILIFADSMSDCCVVEKYSDLMQTFGYGKYLYEFDIFVEKYKKLSELVKTNESNRFSKFISKIEIDGFTCTQLEFSDSFKEYTSYYQRVCIENNNIIFVISNLQSTDTFYIEEFYVK